MQPIRHGFALVALTAIAYAEEPNSNAPARITITDDQVVEKLCEACRTKRKQHVESLRADVKNIRNTKPRGKGRERTEDAKSRSARIRELSAEISRVRKKREPFIPRLRGGPSGLEVGAVGELRTTWRMAYALDDHHVAAYYVISLPQYRRYGNREIRVADARSESPLYAIEVPDARSMPEGKQFAIEPQTVYVAGVYRHVNDQQFRLIKPIPDHVIAEFEKRIRNGE